MKVLKKLGYQVSAFLLIFSTLIKVQHTTNALSARPTSFTTKVFQIKQIASVRLRRRSTAEKIMAINVKKVASSRTSQMATPIGGGAYQEVSQKELLDGVEDNPVLLRRPEKLKNKYYGLRHGEAILMRKSAMLPIFITYILSIDVSYFVHAP